jgi:hypothetical protein
MALLVVKALVAGAVLVAQEVLTQMVVYTAEVLAVDHLHLVGQREQAGQCELFIRGILEVFLLLILEIYSEVIHSN